jgi:hypothetical protein
MKKRETPKSIERQLQDCKLFANTEQMPEAEPYDYANMPDDLPSVNEWYNVRERYLFQMERLSQPG